MRRDRFQLVAAGPLIACLITACASTSTDVTSRIATADKTDVLLCADAGPQTPRDIDLATGTNALLFDSAPGPSALNLCNIHYHLNAEHKAADYSIPAGDGVDGIGGGFRCAMGDTLTASERAPLTSNHCEQTRPGDTIEVHWVYSSCDVEPGPGLSSCVADGCQPTLRVEAQVFTLVNDDSALDFADFDSGERLVGGYHQPRDLPGGTGDPVVFLGSTTGPAYDNEVCSPLEVTWSVRHACAKLDINSLSDWCSQNVFDEGGAQGVRKLVTDPALLSQIE